MSNYINDSDSILGNCLFSAAKLVKNAYIDKYKYSGYGIGFDMKGTFGFLGIKFGRNLIIFCVDMSSSVYTDNKKKDILILGFGPTQELEHTLTAEKLYSINFTEYNKKFCLSLYYYNGVIYLLMVPKLLN